MSDLDVLGAIRDGEDLEDAVVAYLQKWLMSYVAVVERAKGDEVGSHHAPRTWSVDTDFSAFPEDRLPMVIVIATGTDGSPRAEGDGRVRAPFGIGMVTVAAGNNRRNARHNAMVYTSAARKAILAKPSVETNWIGGVTWQGEQYDDLPDERRRHLSAVRSAFSFDCRDVVTVRKALTVPAVTPPGSPPKVLTTAVEFELEGAS